ncbi:hypothetical protein SAMN04488096_102383 [Mesonia phycicola]|uniref:Uncharacterized protein n=1 Tax=Mesonia phycicola TaxID=579105 RepID=A0A1M6C658_9FLAO|nr:hypothetical protein [Mesonia phycicola]SHI56442.1 hypothetical protein SAMN04488096_102383 [Mesonia phycicola]
MNIVLSFLVALIFSQTSQNSIIKTKETPKNKNVEMSHQHIKSTKTTLSFCRTNQPQINCD